MAYVQWNNSYKTGEETIDSQHRKLFRLFNQLQNAMKEGLETKQTNATLRELIEHTKTHIHDEEKLMAEIEYPGLKDHKTKHNELAQKMGQVLVKLKTEKTLNPQDIAALLNEWVNIHIPTEDIKIGEFLKTKKKTAVSSKD
jgi:hemerythrin